MLDVLAPPEEIDMDTNVKAEFANAAKEEIRTQVPMPAGGNVRANKTDAWQSEPDAMRPCETSPSSPSGNRSGPTSCKARADSY